MVLEGYGLNYFFFKNCKIFFFVLDHGWCCISFFMKHFKLYNLLLVFILTWFTERGRWNQHCLLQKKWNWFFYLHLYWWNEGLKCFMSWFQIDHSWWKWRIKKTKQEQKFPITFIQGKYIHPWSSHKSCQGWVLNKFYDIAFVTRTIIVVRKT